MAWSCYGSVQGARDRKSEAHFDFSDVVMVVRNREPDQVSPYARIYLRHGHDVEINGDEAVRFLADFEKFTSRE